MTQATFDVYGAAGGNVASFTYGGRDGEGTITLSPTCDDLAGNQGSASYTVKVDKTPPTIAAAVTMQPNASGWYSAPVTIHFTCSDALSGIPSGACPADQVLSTDGSAVSSTAETVTDLAGNQSSPSNVGTVKLDQTPPTISASATKADGSAYMAGTWANQAVTVHYTCADATSGVATCPADQTFGTEGANQTASGTATDAAGNRASASFGPIQIDTPAPTIVAAATSQPNANGWYNGNVMIHFTCADNTGWLRHPRGRLPARPDAQRGGERRQLDRRDGDRRGGQPEPAEQRGDRRHRQDAARRDGDRRGQRRRLRDGQRAHARLLYDRRHLRRSDARGAHAERRQRRGRWGLHRDLRRCAGQGRQQLERDGDLQRGLRLQRLPGAGQEPAHSRHRPPGAPTR